MHGNRLKDAREAIGLTQKELAERVGMSEQQIYRYESDKSDPTGEALSKLSRVLSVSVDYLLGLVDNPKAQLREEDLSPMERRLIQAVRTGEINELFEVLARLSKKDNQPNIAPR